MFPSKPGFKFCLLLRYGNLSLYDRKYQSDQNPERTQPMRSPHRKPWGRPLVWPHLIVSEKNAYCVLFRTCSWRPHVHGCPPTIHFVLLVWERLSTSNQNGGYHDMSLKGKFVWLLFFVASNCRRFRSFLDILCKGRNIYTQTSRLDAMKLSYKKEDTAHSRIGLQTYLHTAVHTLLTWLTLSYKASLQVSHKTKDKPKNYIKVFKMTQYMKTAGRL